MSTTPEHDARIANMTFSSVYPHYVTKVEKKGRTKAELHEVIEWLTGFNQDKIEERSIVAKRIMSSGNRIKRLTGISKTDEISLDENIDRLKMEIYELTKDMNFKKCATMGEILSHGLDFVKLHHMPANNVIMVWQQSN